MAVINLKQRIVIELNSVIAEKTLTDFSRQRTGETTQNTARTESVARMAAGRIEAEMRGNIGDYDDVDLDYGDMAILDLGVRLALFFYSNVFSLANTTEATEHYRLLSRELERMRDGARRAL
jgi:hypothetical protein